MKVEKINLSLILQSYRIDSKFHLSEGNVIIRNLKASPYPIKKISEFTSRIFYGGRNKRYYIDDIEKGVYFMGSSDMLKNEFSQLKIISRKYTNNLKDQLLEKNWILISRSGTVGNVAYTNELFENKAASEHIIRLVPNENIYSGFLYAFLATRQGNHLLNQGQFGAVIQHITPEFIEDIEIPVFPETKQKEIHQLIVDASDLRVEANRLLEEAIDIFEAEINYHDIDLGFQTGVISSNKLIAFHQRLDAQYQLLWKKINLSKANYTYSKIAELAKEIIVGGRGKRNYVDNGIPFLSSSEMMIYNPIRTSKKISHNTPGIEKMKVSKYDILISRSGTVGNTIIVGDNLNDIAVSEHALRLVIDRQKISPLYVFAFLRTTIGRIAMKASAFGSVIITLNEDLIGNIEIPLLSKEKTDSIIEKIDMYMKNIDMSEIKENQAISLIEKEIDTWQQS